MNYETTADPAGGDDTRPFEGTPSQAGAEAHDVGGDKADPTQSASSAASGKGRR